MNPLNFFKQMQHLTNVQKYTGCSTDKLLQSVFFDLISLQRKKEEMNTEQIFAQRK